jgi:hypothetical protein
MAHKECYDANYNYYKRRGFVDFKFSEYGHIKGSYKIQEKYNGDKYFYYDN